MVDGVRRVAKSDSIVPLWISILYKSLLAAAVAGAVLLVIIRNITGIAVFLSVSGAAASIDQYLRFRGRQRDLSETHDWPTVREGVVDMKTVGRADEASADRLITIETLIPPAAVTLTAAGIGVADRDRVEDLLGFAVHAFLRRVSLLMVFPDDEDRADVPLASDRQVEITTTDRLEGRPPELSVSRLSRCIAEATGSRVGSVEHLSALLIESRIDAILRLHGNVDLGFVAIEAVAVSKRVDESAVRNAVVSIPLRALSGGALGRVLLRRHARRAALEVEAAIVSRAPMPFVFTRTVNALGSDSVLVEAEPRDLDWWPRQLPGDRFSARRGA